MADIITEYTLLDGTRILKVKRTNESDGTGQSGDVFVDASAFPDPDKGTAVDYFRIIECVYDIQGFDSVKLSFDATTDDTALVLSGNYIWSENDPIDDPKSTGYTGDILVTTSGASSTATYDITLTLIKVY